MRTPRKKTGRTVGDSQIRLGPLDSFIGFNLRMAQNASFDVYAQHAHAEHMRPGRFASLMIIDQNPGLTQAELGQATARDKSSITPLVKGLERDGLIERRPSAQDRRSVTLRLTDAGREVLTSLLAHAEEHDRKLDRLVGADNKAEFLRLLKKITTELN
ncbi:MarR family winged helix-turn-helix transcriptional regulator [Rhizobium halophytocola]|uniref:DNA-binding MarR family transcriptional regulator n=1 Tax=Rhizobium halophytocola TaxID=735519 RepID=A0ABS4E2B1_9HYPH|nr:MarR family transcriptional regulator [Rhizobium halophytocola]MBP1852087.1 DNA-binding MarR family transcriptional regulator [Rhizobium halophytocola]